MSRRRDDQRHGWSRLETDAELVARIRAKLWPAWVPQAGVSLDIQAANERLQRRIVDGETGLAVSYGP